jgi:hypothetical protein
LRLHQEALNLSALCDIRFCIECRLRERTSAGSKRVASPISPISSC